MKITELQKQLDDYVLSLEYDEAYSLLDNELNIDSANYKLISIYTELLEKQAELIKTLKEEEMNKQEKNQKQTKINNKLYSLHLKGIELKEANSYYYIGSKLFFSTDKAKKEEGLKYLKCALGLEEARTLELYANLYIEGKEFKKNTKKGLQYALKAFEKGNNDVSLLIGECYFYGIGTDKNIVEAIKYFAMTKGKDEKIALNYLGDIYYFGINVDVNFKESFKYYKKADKLGSKEAKFSLALMYFEGEGVGRNYLKAKDLFEEIIADKKYYTDKQYSACLVNLGYCYLYGYGVEKNYKTSNYYYTRAKKLNDPRAIYALGSNYEKGLGFKENYIKALEYYDKAAELNLSIAKIAANKLRRKLSKQEENNAKENL